MYWRIVLVVLCAFASARGNNKSDVYFFGEVVCNKLNIGKHANLLWDEAQKRPVFMREQAETQVKDLLKTGDRLHTLDSSSEDRIDHLHRVHIAAIQQIQTLSRSLSVNVEGASCGGDYESIFQDLPLSLEYLATLDTGSCLFLSQLLGDDRNETVAVFVNFFGGNSSLDISFPASDSDLFLRNILEALYSQAMTNPPYFVSHGSDHSVNVMKAASQLSDLPDIVEGMTPYLYPSDALAFRRRFVLMTLSIMHDIGYADLDRHNVPKWLHSSSGELFARNILEIDSEGPGVRMLNSLGNFTDELLFGIATHNLDDGLCLAFPQTEGKCVFTVSGDPTVPTSPTTPLLDGPDNTYYRTYTPAKANENPFIFLIRLADNLDAEYSRLSDWQRRGELLRFLERLYRDRDVREAVGNDASDREQVREAARLFWKDQFDLSEDELTIALTTQRADEESFLHFYSNWIIKNIQFDISTFQLRITFRGAEDGVPEELAYYRHIGPALYQINRLATSLTSLELNNESAVKSIRVILMGGGVSCSQDSQGDPLQAFTLRPSYTISGEGPPICENLCETLTRCYTESKERCLAKTGEEVPCPLSFAGKSPFSDLYYPPEIYEEVVQEDEEKKGLSTGALVGIIIGSFLGLLAIIAVVGVSWALFVRRRRAHLRETVQEEFREQ